MRSGRRAALHMRPALHLLLLGAAYVMRLTIKCERTRLAFVDTNVGVAKQQSDFFERLVLCLGEQKVGDDGVGGVRGDVDEKVFPSEFLD